MAEPTYKVILFGTCSPHQAVVSQTQSTMQLVTSAVNVKKLGQIFQPKPGLNKRASSYTPVSSQSVEFLQKVNHKAATNRTST
jgi:hypothetical protein